MCVCLEHSTHLLLVLAPGRVQRLYEGGGMANEHCVAGGSHDHTQHGQPDIRHTLWGLASIPDAQHMAHGLEQRKGVQLTPGVVLQIGSRESDKEKKKERL